MKRIWPYAVVGAICGICLAMNGCLDRLFHDGLTQWDIVHHGTNYGYVNWDRNVNDGFPDYQSAHNAMIKQREWNDKFDEEYRMKRSREYWKSK